MTGPERPAEPPGPLLGLSGIPASQPAVMLVLVTTTAGAVIAAVATAALGRMAQLDHSGEGPDPVLGILTGAGIGAGIGLTVLAVIWYQVVWRERHWIAAHRPYVEQLRALGVPESESRSLYRAGVTAEALRPWTAFGVTTALHWQLVTQARLSLDQARRWTAAGLDARFAAAGTALGADLAQVRDLVADYLDGTGHRADLDNAWTDLADSLDTNLGGRRPRRAEDLELADMLALAPDERRELREGRHSVTWRFRPRPPGPGGY